MIRVLYANFSKNLCYLVDVFHFIVYNHIVCCFICCLASKSPSIRVCTIQLNILINQTAGVGASHKLGCAR